MAEFNVEKLDIFNVRSYEEWESDYLALRADGKKLLEQTGLPDDIRAGWHRAAKENKLFAFGPYSVPLDLVECIEGDTRQMLRNACIRRMPGDDGLPVQIDTLVAVISDLRRGAA